MSLEDKVQAQTESIDRLINTMTKNSGGTGGSGGSANVGGSGYAVNLWNSLNNTVSNGIGGLVKFTNGTYTAADALTNASQVLGGFGTVGQQFAGHLGKIGEEGIYLTESLNKTGNAGANFGNNIGLYDKAVLGARMSLPEFEERIRSNSTAIAGMGSNMNNSALTFLAVGKKIQESDIARNLQATGVGAEEFGNILMTVARNSRGEDMKSAAVQKSLRDNTLALATEMDNIARLTGISRQDQQKNLDTLTKERSYRLAAMAMDEEERKAQDKNITAAGKYGETMQKAAQIYAMGGPQNEEEQKIINAITPEMQDALRRQSEVKGNSPEDEKRRRAIQDEIDSIAERLSQNKAYLKTMSNLDRAGDATGKAQAKAAEELADYGNKMKQADRDAAALGMSREQFLAQQKAQADKDRLAAGKLTAEGSEGAAALPAQTVNSTTRLMKDISAGWGENVNKLNIETGKVIKDFEGLHKVLRPYSQEAMGKVPENIVKSVKEAGGIRETEIPESARKNSFEFGTGGPNFDTSKLFRDFGAGTDAVLHGKEAVINEKQFKNMISGMQSGLQSAMETAKKEAPNMKQLSDIMRSTGPNSADITDSRKREDDDRRNAYNSLQNTHDDTTSEMTKGITELNKRLERLIAAVEDGRDLTVRAIKSKGNMIA